MKATLGGGAEVPLGRVVAEHRAWLIPLALVFLVTVGVLVAGVLPLSRAVASSERRAQAARQTLAAAEQEFKAAENLRGSQTLASRDLETFYGEVLPKDFGAARRITHIKLAQLAQTHGVRYERMSASPETARDSSLERLKVTMTLAGDYDDFRSFLYDLETSPDFLVIDNIVLTEDEDQRGAVLSFILDVSTYYVAGRHGG
jgi:Tfp pilus assembly protein PilO